MQNMPQQINNLVVIFAHPDDEGAIAGTLAHYANQGSNIKLVCATRGEVGEISDPALATPDTLGEVREQELIRACKVLGVTDIEFLDYKDSGMQGTKENEDPKAYINADPKQVIQKLKKIITDHTAEVVITFEPFGWYGHPDHRATSEWVTKTVTELNNIAQDTKTGKEVELYYSVIPFSKYEEMINKAISQGLLEKNPFDIEIPKDKINEAENLITHQLEVYDFYDLKTLSSKEHKTQFGEEGMFDQIPDELLKEVSRFEFFAKVE